MLIPMSLIFCLILSALILVLFGALIFLSSNKAGIIYTIVFSVLIVFFIGYSIGHPENFKVVNKKAYVVNFEEQKVQTVDETTRELNTLYFVPNVTMGIGCSIKTFLDVPLDQKEYVEYTEGILYYGNVSYHKHILEK